MSSLSRLALLTLAFSAGTATFFAPCAFPLLPGYVSYFLGDTVAQTDDPVQSDDGRLVGRVRHPIARALLVSVAAGLGMTLVYVSLAGTTVALGARALADVAVLEVVVGLVFVVAGATMATRMTAGRPLIRLPERRRSVGGFFLFGALYAGAAAGCTAPLFVAVVVKGIAVGPVLGVGLAVAYALGMSGVLVALTLAAALGGSSVATTVGRYTSQIRRVAGVLLALSGVAEIYYYLYGFPAVMPQ